MASVAYPRLVDARCHCCTCGFGQRRASSLELAAQPPPDLRGHGWARPVDCEVAWAAGRDEPHATLAQWRDRPHCRGRTGAARDPREHVVDRSAAMRRRAGCGRPPRVGACAAERRLARRRRPGWHAAQAVGRDDGVRARGQSAGRVGVRATDAKAPSTVTSIAALWAAWARPTTAPRTPAWTRSRSSERRPPDDERAVGSMGGVGMAAHGRASERMASLEAASGLSASAWRLAFRR